MMIYFSFQPPPPLHDFCATTRARTCTQLSQRSARFFPLPLIIYPASIKPLFFVAPSFCVYTHPAPLLLLRGNPCANPSSLSSHLKQKPTTDASPQRALGPFGFCECVWFCIVPLPPGCPRQLFFPGRVLPVENKNQKAWPPQKWRNNSNTRKRKSRFFPLPFPRSSLNIHQFPHKFLPSSAHARVVTPTHTHTYTTNKHI
jgi:hypothetical protein